MIKTKAIRDKAEESDGLRVLVTRYHPRGIKKEHYDKWFRDLAPSRQLLDLYKNEYVTEDEFEEAYRAEMKEADAYVWLAILKNKHWSGQTVTLLCFEPPGEFCHRHILKEIIDPEAGEKP